jgi:hypothetical protein
MDWFAVLEYAPHLADWTMTVLMGLGIAATCGLRAFLPMLAVNLLAMTGRVELHEAFGFMGTWPATFMFLAATIAEVAGDKFPGVDHFMDTYGLLVKPMAATVSAAAFIADVDPLTALALGLIGGGASASLLGVAKAKVRALSSVATLGLGNPVLSVGEDAAAVAGITLTVVAPMLAFGVLMFTAGCVVAWAGARRAHRRALSRLAPA